MPIIGSSKLQITGDITASGAIVAEEFKTDFISGSSGKLPTSEF